MAKLRDRRELLPLHVPHLISPRDPQVGQGTFPVPLHFTHLQENVSSLGELQE